MIIFLSHPYTGSPEENIKKATEICQKIHYDHPEYVIISPLNNFSFLPCDTDYNRMMDYCYQLIDKCDMLVSCGESKGCLLELGYAAGKGKQIRFWDYDNREITMF